MSSRHLSQPLSRLATAARQMASGDFDVNIHVSTGDEMEEVAHAFNFMKDSLKANEEARHKLVADVAHELRTPLAVLRGNFESMQEGIIEPTQETIVCLHDEVLRLSRMCAGSAQSRTDGIRGISLKSTTHQAGRSNHAGCLSFFCRN